MIDNSIRGGGIKRDVGGDEKQLIIFVWFCFRTFYRCAINFYVFLYYSVSHIGWLPYKLFFQSISQANHSLTVGTF